MAIQPSSTTPVAFMLDINRCLNEISHHATLRDLYAWR
jgi:hypothetical protein